MSYIIIELHGGPQYGAIVTDKDGNNQVFDDREAAEAEASGCQAPLIIEIG